jgi:hypothetical protein
MVPAAVAQALHATLAVYDEFDPNAFPDRPAEWLYQMKAAIEVLRIEKERG